MFVMRVKKTLPLSQAISSGVKETSREEHVEKTVAESVVEIVFDLTRQSITVTVN